MKLSKFNNVVPYGEKSLLYNAFSDKFILVEPKLKELFQQAKKVGLEYLKLIHPSFYEVLLRDGFVINYEVDELEEVKKLSAYVDSVSDKEYRLIINPTMNCNFKCWYCYESHIKDSKMTAQTILNIKQHIQHIVNTQKGLETFRISWFGGEPLLYYEKVIKPVAEYAIDLLEKNNIKLSSNYTTNGFLIKESMIPEFHRSNVTSFQITLDGNREIHDTVRYVNAKKGSYDEIISNVLLLCRNKFNVSLRINYTATNLNHVEDIIDDILPLEAEFRRYITVVFHKVWQEKANLGEKVKELNQKFRASGFKSVYGGLPNNVRNSCYADRKNQATINYNGEVYKCTARNFSSDTKEGVLTDDGHIIWNQKYEDRLNVKFKNKPCLECPILPICNGGCSQKALENIGKDYCVYDFDFKRKADVILNKYDYLVNVMSQYATI